MASLQSRLSDLITAIGTDYKAIIAKFRGTSELVYRYTVTVSDKASIDTGLDAADAGSGDWTNGDLLEIYAYLRTDEAVVNSVINVVLNNDTAAHYDLVQVQDLNATVSGTNVLAGNQWAFNAPGASCAASVFSHLEMKLQNYLGTVGNKSGSLLNGIPDQTAANMRAVMRILEFRSTAAVTRLSMTPATSGKKFKVGSQILIYKRRSS